MSDLASAIKQICDEKGLSYEAVIGTIESALAAAYRKDFGEKNQNIKIEFNPETGKSKVFDVKTIVEDMPEIIEEEVSGEEVDEKAENKKKISKSNTEDEANEEDNEEERRFNPKTEMQVSDAKMIKKTAKVGDEIKMKLEVPDAYGRMAAQTAKQVIIQRLREAERNMIFDEFKDKEREVVSGVVQRREGKVILVDLAKAVGVLPSEEQIYGEKYVPGGRIKVYVKEVKLTPKGPEIILSRTSDEILKKVFYLEIPEISNGLIELKAVAREAGSRSKVAVWTESENVDPIGSCVGQRGARIQTVIAELGGEKVDIIEYDEDPLKFIANSLSPAKILHIKLLEEEKKAKVTVSEDQLSLAIGKGGQNARLAARLTGWKIDIVENDSKETESDTDKTEKTKKKDKKSENEEVSDDEPELKQEEELKKKKSKKKNEKEEKNEEVETSVESNEEVKNKKKEEKEEK